MKLLIIGATGATGRKLVKQAIAQGHEVTALVRNAAKAAFSLPVKVVVGDVLEPSSLRNALVGQEAVISSLGSGPSGPFREIAILSKGTENSLPPGVYHDKDRQEAVVRNSGLDWTLVRPAILNGTGRGIKAVRAFSELAGMKAGTISRSDLAAFCLQELAEGRYRRQAPVITQ